MGGRGAGPFWVPHVRPATADVGVDRPAPLLHILHTLLATSNSNVTIIYFIIFIIVVIIIVIIIITIIIIINY